MPSIKNNVFNFKKKPKSSLSRFSKSPKSSQLTPTQISKVLGMEKLRKSDKAKIKKGKRSQAFAFN